MQAAPIKALSASALASVAPVVVVNRRVDAALDQLSKPVDAPFPTIHDDVRRDPMTLARRAVRTTNEIVRGTHGDGADAGRTVYGSVRFVPTDDATAGAGAIVSRLRDQGDVGIRAYGPVSFVLDPDTIAQRTTFAADDTGATRARVRGASDLATVVAERIERSGGIEGSSVSELEAMPQQAAVDAIRGWLLSDALGSTDGYIEAQVRRVATSDVLAGVVDLRSSEHVERRSVIDPGDAPSVDDASAILARLESAAIATERIVD